MPGRIAIRSGGQTGVDRAALDVAIAGNIPYAGWCPRGGWAEDCTGPPGLLARYDKLVETPAEDPEQRTAWNVRDSHATLIVLNGTSLDASPGTRFAATCARLVFLRPCHVADLASSDAMTHARRWLDLVVEGAGHTPCILNFAGPRESESPGVYTAACDFLSRLIDVTMV
jgi:hypothetical protein